MGTTWASKSLVLRSGVRSLRNESRVSTSPTVSETLRLPFFFKGWRSNALGVSLMRSPLINTFPRYTEPVWSWRLKRAWRWPGGPRRPCTGEPCSRPNLGKCHSLVNLKELKRVAFSDLPAALKAHRSYFLASIRHWGPHFSLIKRSNILRSYLNLLFDSLRKNKYTPAVIVDREASTTTTTTSLVSSSSMRAARSGGGASSSPSRHNTAVLAAWRQEVQQVERIYEDLLRGTIANRFPRAGEINKPVLDFVDRVAEGWELAGRRTEDAPQAIEVSPRILILIRVVEANLSLLG
jgi:hypothetical protein